MFGGIFMAKFDNLEAVFNKLDEEEAIAVYGGKDLYMFGMKVGSPEWNRFVASINTLAGHFERKSPAPGWGGLSQR